MSVISIRRYLEQRRATPATSEPEPSAAVAQGVIEGWRKTLKAAATHIIETLPMPDCDAAQHLNTLAEAVDFAAGPEHIDRTTGLIEAELQSWSRAARGRLQQKADQVREIMAKLASLGDAVGQRDQRYVAEFGDLSVRLRAVARMEDLTSVRRSIAKSASEISACAARLRNEGERCAAELRREVETYRLRLEESERRATTDSLTGLGNRDALDLELQLRTSPEAPSGRNVCAILLDLNGFKAVNDRYGHAVGDELLRVFGRELKSHFRTTDLIARCGGDEFVVITDSNAADAQRHYARLRRWASGEFTVAFGGQLLVLEVGASIGLAQWNHTESPAELVARADRSMYEDKKKVVDLARREKRASGEAGSAGRQPSQNAGTRASLLT